MIKLETILKNYKEEWEMELDDRFGRRLAEFLPDEKLKLIGFTRTKTTPRKIKEWNEENVLAELKEDIEFAWEKACNRRGISSELMVEVVQRWCKVLENGLNFDPNYTDYGKSFLQEVDKKYDWHLTDRDVSELSYAQKQWAKGQNVVILGQEDNKHDEEGEND